MPHKLKHARRHKFEKAKYRVTNWRDYEAALRRRGDVTLWISQAAISGWVTSPGERGIYSDLAIETSMALRLVFSLALRQTEGFVGSVFTLMELDMPGPDHTTLSRRGQGLEVTKTKSFTNSPLDIVVDSAGLKIFGPGKWLAAGHGGSNRREWRKLHLGLDPKSGEFVARDLTSRHVADVTALPDLLNQVDGRIEIFLADARPGYTSHPRDKPMTCG